MRECTKGIVCLVGQDIAVRQKQYTRSPRAHFIQVPACLEQLPDNLERNTGFARSGGQSEQNAVFALCHSLNNGINSICLVVAGLKASGGLVRDSGKQIPQRVWDRVGHLPQGFRAGEGRDFFFFAGLGIYLVNGVPVGGKSKAHMQQLGI